MSRTAISSPTPANGPLITALRRHRTAIALGLVAAAAAAYLTVFGLLLHYSFHSYGWDLGIFDQLLWNTAHGRPFEYSFRDISYLGDHWQPALLLLAPLAWLGAGPAPLLVVQGLVFGAAAIPLFAAARRLAAPGPAWLATGAYLLGLAQARAATYDFHLEAFAPLLAFTALWALASGRPAVFLAAALAILLLKEDAVLLTLALCWVAWFAFGLRREAWMTGAFALVYGALVSLVLMPAFLGHDSNPLLERYGYLGDSAAEILFTALTRPDLLIDHLAHPSSGEAAFLLLLGVGFLPLLAPRLWPPLALLILVPLLSQQEQQRTLTLHYMVVPATFAMVVSVVALRCDVPQRVWRAAAAKAAGLSVLSARLAAPAAMFALALGVFAWKSPLPPSFAVELDRYHVDRHSRIARSFLDMIPSAVPVSAQATYVPHLSQREDIYEFPRVLNAEYVLLDRARPVPDYDQPRFKECQDALPRLGFDLIRQEDGIALWQRTRPAASESCR